MITITDLYSNTSNVKLRTFNGMVNESYISTILGSDDLSQIQITPVEANVFIGDFHGLLRSKNVVEEVFALTTIMNGLKSSSDFNGIISMIKIPSVTLIRSLTM